MTAPNSRGRLYVVDYPEENPAFLAELLRGLANGPPPIRPIRVLLLTRQSFDWWRDSMALRATDHLFDAFPLELGALGPDDSVQLFFDARRSLSEFLDQPEIELNSEQVRDWVRSDPDVHALPLLLVAAAVHSIHYPGDALGLSGPALLRALAERERIRVDGLGDSVGFGPRTASCLVALAVLRGHLDDTHLLHLAESDPGFGLPSPSRLLDMVRRLPTWSSSLGLTAPRPDLLAAAFLIQALTPFEALAPEWIWSICGRVDTVDGLLDQLGRVLFDTALVLDEPDNPLLRWVISAIERRPERSLAWESLGGTYRPPEVALPLTVAINRQLVQMESADRQVHAGRLYHLALHLTRAGDPEAAVGYAQQSVVSSRELLDGSRESLLRLADALFVLAMSLHDANRSSDALAVITECLTIRRALPASKEPEDTLELGRSLNNLALVYLSLKRHDEGLEAILEAVSLHRNLLKAAGNRFAGDLARALHNASLLYRQLERSDEALAAIREALSIRRDLDRSKPWRYGWYVAISLNRLSELLASRGDLAGAIDAQREAITLCRRLVSANPRRFGLQCIVWLNDQTQLELRVGLAKQAVTTQVMQSRLFHSLIDQGGLAGAYDDLRRLAAAWVNLSYQAVESKQPEVAHAILDRLIEFLETLRIEKRKVWDEWFQISLFGAYQNRGNARALVKRHSEAIDDYSTAIAEVDSYLGDVGHQKWFMLQARAVSLVNRCIERLRVDESRAARVDIVEALAIDQRLKQEFQAEWPPLQHHQLAKSLVVAVPLLVGDQVPELAREAARAVVGIIAAELDKGRVETTRPVVERLLNLGSGLISSGPQDLGLEILRAGVQAIDIIASAELTSGRVEAAKPIVERLFELGDRLYLSGQENLGLATIEQGLRHGLKMENAVRAQYSGPTLAKFLNGLGYCMALLISRNRHEADLSRAEALINDGLAQTDRNEDQLLWANLQDSLGFVLMLRSGTEGSATCTRRAIDAFEAALSGFRAAESEWGLRIVGKRLEEAKTTLQGGLVSSANS